MQKTVRLVSYIIFILCLTTVFSHAQNINSIPVDQLSELQLKELIQKAEYMNYSDAQIEQMAIVQGMPPSEAAKLLQRIRDFRKKGKQDVDTINLSKESVGHSYLPDTTSNNFFQQQNDVLESLKPKIFGTALFKNADITFQPTLNIPTPEGYIIGPGDELLIDLTGDNEANYNSKVNSEGYINVEYIGKIGVGGLSVEEGTSKIKNMMLGTYPALKNGKTKVSVNLGNIRSIKVTLLGEITRPGTYTLSSLSTVFNALYASGGPNENGSFRMIEVIRNNQIIATVDIYDFLLRGMQTHNIRLEDQDVIRVPVFRARVEIAGEIKRPALFETLQNESLNDVLDFAGRFTTKAFTASIKVFQNTERERRVVDVPKEEFAVYEPHNGDKYIVEAILGRFENRVQVKGAVFRPGTFELGPGLTLSELIQKASGLTEDAFLPRGYIYRLKPDNTQDLISFNVAEITNGSAPDIVLQREDVVQISSIFDLQDEYKITVGGEVRQPGTFKYVDNMTLGNVIQMSGGFKEGASPNRIEVARRVKNSDATSSSAETAQIFTVDIDADLKIKDSDFKLKPFDIVSVRNLAGYEVQTQVKIEGEVLYPGIYTLKNKDERVSDVIKRAGGLTAFAYMDGASLTRSGSGNTIGKNTLSGNDKKENEKLFNFYRISRDGTDGTGNPAEIAYEQQALPSNLVGIDLKKILDMPHRKHDIVMQNGDIIQIPRALQTVKVNGEVLRPNNIIYLNNRSFKSYINGAGGYTRNALKRGAFIQYANGSVAATRKILFFNNYPPVKPGAEIFVPNYGAAKEKMTTQAWISIATAVVSMSAMVFAILKN